MHFAPAPENAGPDGRGKAPGTDASFFLLAVTPAALHGRYGHLLRLFRQPPDLERRRDPAAACRMPQALCWVEPVTAALASKGFPLRAHPAHAILKAP